MRCILLGLLLVADVNAGSLQLGPQPGDVYREFVWTGPYRNAGNWQRVTDPGAMHSGAQVFLPNPINHIDLDYLEGALRAEITLEQWGGHAGTSAKRVRFNGSPWIDVPEPAIPGGAGSASSGRLGPECFQYFTYPTISLSVEQLRGGDNTFEFTCGKQVCFNFGWGQWGVYAAIVRLYYEPTVARVDGAVRLPDGLVVHDESLRLAVDLRGDTGAVTGVDFIGRYEDFDITGDGSWHDWQVTTRFGRMQNHIGTADAEPWSVIWATSWLPDQPLPMSVLARIRHDDGLYRMTAAVDGLSLERPDRSVRLYRPFDVPGSWQTRAGSRHRNKVFVPHDLTRARQARLLMTTWSGAHANAIEVNGTSVTQRVGRDHDYSFDQVDVPLPLLRVGSNVFGTWSTTQQHGIEVLWPGIALLVEYETPAEAVVAPTADLAIFADALASSWRLENAGDSDDLFAARVDLAATPAYRSERALGIEASGSLWRVEFVPAGPVDISGYGAVHFAFQGANLGRRTQDSFSLRVNGERLSLLGAARLDLGSAAWQTISIPLDSLGLRFPYIESIALTGNFSGSFYLDDLRLVTTTVATVVGDNDSSGLAQDINLLQAFPNPFNGTTTIPYSLPVGGDVDLSIYNLAGQKVAVLVHTRQASGAYAVHWDGEDSQSRQLATGVYLVRLESVAGLQSRRILILR